MTTDFQLRLFDTPPLLGQIVNVAKVKHRSPLRYPGGKTWLVPRIFQWLLSRSERPAEFIEPFCGGAIVGLTVAFENLADHVTLVERDEQVAALWQTILEDEGGGQWLAEKIMSYVMTEENLEEELTTHADSVRVRAWQTLLRNRTNRGGILAKGAGKIKQGEASRGVSSRWYPTTLAQRIRDLVSIRDRITFIHGDGLAVIEEKADHAQSIFFIDPPYTVGVAGKRAGTRLYDHSELDHERLFALAATVQGDFLMTYDNASAVRALAEQRGFDTLPVAMKNTHHAQINELLVGRSLHWARP